MNWENRLRHLANKHGFDLEATAFMADAIREAGGRFAQWKHPALGGFGQWIPGMTALSPREPGLEERLNKLCMDLLALLHETGHPDAPGRDGTIWWPITLGLRPDATGAQDRARYAYFADPRRLAVDPGDGRVTVYDTGEHRVHGVARATGADHRLVFQSQLGEVDLNALTVVEPTE